MYHNTTVFPEKVSIKVKLGTEQPVIIDLADEEDSTDSVTVFLTKEKARELFLELELALGEFEGENRIAEEDKKRVIELEKMAND